MMTLCRVALCCALAGFLAGRPLWGASLGADTLAARVKACTACHGEQGRAGPDGYYPRLAGKPAGYLYHQLLNFRDGRRHYGLMSTLVEPLTDRYLMEIARYFADLQVPYPPPARPVVSDSVLAHGRRIAVQGEPQRGVPACTHCHGERLTGMLPATPGLLGLPQDYLNAQLGAWRSGQRRAHAPDCMREVVERLAPADLAAVAAWLAAQPVPVPAAPAAKSPPPATAARPACGSDRVATQGPP